MERPRLSRYRHRRRTVDPSTSIPFSPKQKARRPPIAACVRACPGEEAAPAIYNVLRGPMSRQVVMSEEKENPNLSADGIHVLLSSLDTVRSTWFQV
uniref:Uncharacterized protein n=1 Tax=Steinernema glaseri TaxID=37863 RepID=A0A1I8A9U1_9BILA